MNNLLNLLMEEYQRLLEVEAKYVEWKEKHPDLYPWNYPGQRVSKTRFERLGIMIRQTMIDFERKSLRND